MLQANDLQFVSPEMDQQFVICSIDKKSEKTYVETMQGRLSLDETRQQAERQIDLFKMTGGWYETKNITWAAELLATLPEDTLKKFRMTRIANE